MAPLRQRWMYLIVGENTRNKSEVLWSHCGISQTAVAPTYSYIFEEEPLTKGNLTLELTQIKGLERQAQVSQRALCKCRIWRYLVTLHKEQHAQHSREWEVMLVFYIVKSSKWKELIHFHLVSPDVTQILILVWTACIMYFYFKLTTLEVKGKFGRFSFENKLKKEYVVLCVWIIFYFFKTVSSVHFFLLYKISTIYSFVLFNYSPGLIILLIQTNNISIFEHSFKRQTLHISCNKLWHIKICGLLLCF